MRVELDNKEKENLKIFFINNMDFLKSRDFSNENNLIELINRYGAYLDKRHLNSSRNLLMLLVDLKEELTRIKILSPSLNERNIRILKRQKENLTSNSLLRWQNYFFDEIPTYKEKPSHIDDLDAITDMLAKRIQEREEKVLQKKNIK